MKSKLARERRVLWILVFISGTCLVTTTSVRSSYNVSSPLPQNEESLLLGHCYSSKPNFVITSKSNTSTLEFTLYEGVDRIKIIPEDSQGSVYNHSENLQIEQNYKFKDANGKKFVNAIDSFFF